MAIKDEILDELLADYQNHEDLLGQDGIFNELKKRLLERDLGAELTDHLDYETGDRSGGPKSNCRNGHSAKKVKGEAGELEIAVLRDRDSSFDPRIIKKGQSRFDGFDDKFISLYARGMTVREIKGHLKEIYSVTVSPNLISRVTDEVIDEVRAWQNRPLDPVYPIIIFDALRVKIRDDGVVRNKAVYLALAINMDGGKEVLGLWIEQTEGAKFWLKVKTELKNRGVNDVFIAVVDGLKGFPEAQVQTCIVHMVRHSLNFVSWKQKRLVAADLKAIYKAETVETAEAKLAEFEEKWDVKYPPISRSWRRNWERITPFFAYPPDVRRVIYTTNAIESLHMTLRKVIKNRGHFPNDEAAAKLLYLALRNVSKRWTGSVWNWKQTLNQFAILFQGRMPGSA